MSCASTDRSHPDLSGLGIGIAGVDGTPAILPLTRHPYARRFEVRHGGDTHAVPIGGAWPLPDREPGEHTATLATHTPFGAHGAHALRWVTRPA
jgi:hypothetical protein